MSQEAFSAMKNRLNENGVLVMNCFGDFDPDKDFMVASLNKTLSSVFWKKF